MLDFSNFVDLPLVWGGILATALFLYVLLDGFDLGVGMLFPYAPSPTCRIRLMNAVAPFWDSNETWLVLAGGGLLVVFPLAFAILMPAFYIPIFIMLFGLIMRGASLEFWHKSSGVERRIWEWVFALGSLVAALAQGSALGGFLNGVRVNGRDFVGSAFDWLSPLSVITAVGVTVVYLIFGTTWGLYKTKDQTAQWLGKLAPSIALYGSMVLMIVGFAAWVKNQAMCQFGQGGICSLPFANVILFASIISSSGFIYLHRILKEKIHADEEKGGNKSCYGVKYFILSAIFVLIFYLGLLSSVYPYAVPYVYTLSEVAGANEGLSLSLVGVMIFLPIVLSYIVYVFYIFRGKTADETNY